MTWYADPTQGEIPEGWELTTLGDVCESGGGFVQTGPFGSQLHAYDYVPVGVPSIMPVNIGENRIVEDGIKRVSEQDAERLSRHRARPGDIVFSRRGDVERRSLVRDAEGGWLCGTGCLLVRLGEGIVDPVYASYYLAHPDVRKWIVRHAVGSTMPNLNTTILSSVPFALPPLRVQRAIARILGALDDKIELNREMNRTLEATAQAIFRSWFVDFDPVVAKADGRKPFGMTDDLAALFPDRFVESELGPIPEGWEVSIVVEEFNLTMGQSPPGKTYNSEGQGYTFYQGRTDFSFRFPSRRVFCTAPTRFAEEGDTLVSVRAPVGDINLAWERCAIGRGLSAVRHATGASSFTYYTMKALEPDFLVFEGEGTLFGSMSKKKFEQIKILQPPQELIERFEARAGPLDQRLRIAWSESQTLAALRDLLLPKLLSGEVRVAEAEDAAEALL